MYNNVRACVKTSNGLTDFFSSTSGVKQGCHLSPSLFNIFVNDITDIFDLCCKPVSLGGSKVNCLLYADDLLVMSNSEHGLQQCLNKINDYTKKWKLQVNLNKTKLMIFDKSGWKLKASCSFGSKTVDMATSYTYLGSVLTPSGSFSANQDRLYNKGLRIMFTLVKDFHPLNGTPVRIFLELFDSMIRPVLLYNCEIWGAYIMKISSFQSFREKIFQTGLLCEMLQIKKYKMILGVNTKATNSAVRAELGRFPLHITIFLAILKVFISLIK